MVGKYVELTDSYKSLNEALTHGGIANEVRVEITHVDSERTLPRVLLTVLMDHRRVRRKVRPVALRRAERVRVTRDLDDVVVPGHVPKHVVWIPIHRRFFPKPGVEGPRFVVAFGKTEVDPVEALRHGTLLGSGETGTTTLLKNVLHRGGE
jgi:hypothetical protein